MDKTNNRLIQASEHLLYEYRMMFWTAKELHKAIPKEGFAHNAILESFAIHVRNLIEFFFNDTQKYNDDVLADHYFDHEKNEWKNIRPIQSPLLKSTIKQAHKQIAHLTYSRNNFSDDQKLWRFVNIVDEIENVMKNYFLKNVSKKSYIKSGVMNLNLLMNSKIFFSYLVWRLI